MKMTKNCRVIKWLLSCGPRQGPTSPPHHAQARLWVKQRCAKAAALQLRCWILTENQKNDFHTQSREQCSQIGCACVSTVVSQTAGQASPAHRHSQHRHDLLLLSCMTNVKILFVPDAHIHTALTHTRFEIV